MQRIQIDFPFDFEITEEEEMELQNLVRKINERWMNQNPDQKAWLFAIGHEPEILWMSVSRRPL